MMIEVRTKDFMFLLKKVTFSEWERRHISKGIGRTRVKYHMVFNKALLRNWIWRFEVERRHF